ncbi:MAG: ATP-binding protein [archaeon]
MSSKKLSKKEIEKLVGRKFSESSIENVEAALKESTLDVLKGTNVWWETGSVPEALIPENKRFLFDDLLGFLEDRRIIGVLGPRRTGKTTLMYQLIEFLVKERKVNPKQILFFSGDDAELKLIDEQTKSGIGVITKTYFEDYLKQDYYKGKKVFIFIDEVHKISDWQLWLKKLYDLKYNVKIIVSGSSIAKIRQGQKESLTGRIIEFILFPLNFQEFLKFNNLETPVKKVRIEEINSETVRQLKEIGLNERLQLKKMFYEYLLVGGFPEWFETKNIQKWQLKLKQDVIKRVIYDDIATLYKVKNPSQLESLLLVLSSLQSQCYSYNSIANTLKIDNETAQNYVNYLKESFLVFELQNFGTSIERQIRKNYKYALIDSGLRNALKRITELEKVNALNKGFIIEGSVQQQLFKIAEKESIKVFYYKNKEEIDVIVKGKKVIPIEVKFTEQTRQKSLRGITKFMEKNKLKKGIMITKDKIDLIKIKEKEIIMIPIWLFELMI